MVQVREFPGGKEAGLAVDGRFRETFEGRHEYAKEWKDTHHGKVVGYFCIYVPEEVLYAAGMLPVRITGRREPEDVTEPHMTSWWCPHSRSCLAEALQGRYDYMDGIVVASTCPHIYQTFYSWQRHLPPDFTYHFWMPMNIRNRHAPGYVRKQLSKLVRSLEEWTGEPIAPEALDRAIGLYNTNRDLLQKINNLRKRDNPPLTGAQALEMALSSMVMDKEEHNQLLTRALEELQGGDGAKPEARLMILGSENDDVELIRLIESMGGGVVVDELCTGGRYSLGKPVDGNGDPLAAIATHYVDRPSSCPHKDLVERRRIPYIMQMLEEYRVEGVIYLLEKFCEPHGYDLPTLTSMFQERGIPMLLLEVDLTTPAGQFSTRIEAFLDLIRT